MKTTPSKTTLSKTTRYGCLTLLGALLTTTIAPPLAHSADEPATKKAAAKKVAAKKVVDPLHTQVQQAIDISEKRFLTANVHTPWQIMHGLLALRTDYLLKMPGTQKKVRAIDWISNDPTFRGEHWFLKSRHGGRAHPYNTDYAFEGHPNQFLAILAMADVPMTHKFKTQNGEITIADMVKHAQMTVNATEEVTWTLWALSHYLGPDARWRNAQGDLWSVERLVDIQTKEPVYRAACGGSHGMFALTYARNVFLKKKKPLRGYWLAADQKIQRYIRIAKQLQNSDGTFSTEYFEQGGRSTQFEKRLNTSGHTLEFLILALPKERLKETWVRRGVNAIVRDLIDNKSKPAECGSLYHAMNGLVIYRDRTNPGSKKTRPTAARKPKPKKTVPSVSSNSPPRTSGEK